MEGEDPDGAVSFALVSAHTPELIQGRYRFDRFEGARRGAGEDRRALRWDASAKLGGSGGVYFCLSRGELALQPILAHALHKKMLLPVIAGLRIHIYEG
jgi:hypothetical protein